MGSNIEINDTLQLTTEQGFPAHLLDLARHQKKPVTIDALRGRLFKFKDKPDARIFHLDPVRVFYAHNIDGRWLFWGRALIQSQTIYKKLDAKGKWKKGEWLTAGTYRIETLYDPEFQKLFTLREAPAERSYFR